VNGIWPDAPTLGRSPGQMLRAAATQAGLDLGDEAIDALATVNTAHARRVANQKDALRELGSVSLPRIDLPYLFTERIGASEISHLAGSLKEHL